MSGFCRKTPKRTQCDPVDVGEKTPAVCQPFEICLPFGGRLFFDGACLHAEPGRNVPDGTYGVIVVKDGCIVDARPNPVFEYTPGPCAPAAVPCDESSGGGGIELAPGACNLLTRNASGQYGVFLNTEDGDGASVDGCGSTTRPLRISVASQDIEKTHIQSEDRQAVQLSGQGTANNPYVIGLAETGIAPGDYGGFTVDQYGRITKFASTTEGTIYSIVEGPGIKVTSTSGVATISLDSVINGGTYNLGGYNVSLDLAGRVTDIEQGIALEPAVYDPYYYMFGLNEYGSVVSIERTDRVPDNQFSKMFNGSRSTNRMQIATNLSGYYRIIYRGYIPTTTGTGTTATPGLVSLPHPYSVTIDDIEYEAYAIRSGTAITEIHCLTDRIAAGTHVVEIKSGADTATGALFTDRAVLDVSITSRG